MTGTTYGSGSWTPMRSDERALTDEWVEHLEDPGWFVRRLFITTKQGELRQLHPLFDEQVQCVDAFRGHNLILAEKPRQVGSTTVWVALFFWRMLTARSSYDVLAVMHEYASVARFTMQFRQHVHMLPRALRPNVVLDNTKEIRIRVAGAESSFRTTMAGGRGQGRSFSYRGVLFSEAGLYPRGSSARGVGGDVEGLDEAVYAAIAATMPPPHLDPLVRVVVESTVDAAGGLFYKLVHRAVKPDSGWAFLFFPWYKFAQYTMVPPPTFKPTPEEKGLLTIPGMTLGNIMWRRYMLEVKGYGLRRFRKEFPTTWDEPFLLAAGMWFDIAKIRRKLDAQTTPMASEGYRRIIPYDPGRPHFLGVDTSGGTGGDSAVITVVRDDCKVVAVWSSNLTPAREQAEMVSRMSAEHGGAQALIESGNVHGHAVIARAMDLGVPLWLDDQGKDFVATSRANASLMDWMKYLLDGDMLDVADTMTLEECMHVREQRGGKIEADQGYHDDHVDGLALALWCARATIISRWAKKDESGTLTIEPEPIVPQHRRRNNRGPRSM